MMRTCRSLDDRKIRLNRRHLAIVRISAVHRDDERRITAQQADDNVGHHSARVSLLSLVSVHQ